jgi:hypothetical protein
MNSKKSQKMKYYTKSCFLFLLLVAFSISVSGQEEDIDKQVQVVKAYKPVVKDAYKISELPGIKDTSTVTEEFNYYLIPKLVETEFKVKPIPAATMVGEPLRELYGSYVKVGMGSKLSPLIDLYISNKRSKEYAIGAGFSHASSGGQIPLKNGEKVKSSFADNDLHLFGRKFFDNSVLGGNIDLNSRTRHFYGYNYKVDTLFEKKDIKQNFLNINMMVNYKTTYVDSAHLNYDLKFAYDHLEDNFQSKEDHVALSGKFNKFFNTNIVGLDFKAHYLKHDATVTNVDNSYFMFKPWIAKFGDEWRIQGGINFTFDAVDGNTKGRIYPVAEMEYDIVNHYIIPYAGIDGNVGLNTYQSVSQKNPYILPGLHVENTNNKMIFYGGLKGNLNSSTYYNMRVRYTFFDDMYFFINDLANTSNTANKFNVIYDNGEVLNLFGEMSFEISRDFSLRAEGNYYQYTLYNESKPWHKPTFDLMLSARYDLRDKIILTTDIFFNGKRYAREGINENTMKTLELDGYVDFNFGLEYRYSKILSGFLQFRNILSDNYYRWNRYPVYGLEAFLGITYAF